MGLGDELAVLGPGLPGTDPDGVRPRPLPTTFLSDDIIKLYVQICKV